ncbi:BP74-related protein [Streptomyces sp. NBC_00344]|uniref:BP74-related protein n=1 Tax=Streptomyces sp. NBC_00344 TaxID=2975720 RepID=UPI002E213A3F
MRRITTKLGTLAAVALLALTTTQAARAESASPSAPRAAADAPAYFKMQDIARDEFIVKITEAAKIAEAREIIADDSRKILIGRIVKRKADYNPRWDFHYNPDTVSFADMAIEVCDSTIRYTDDHLDEAGGAFLPGLYWCPWTGRLTEEVPAP